MKLITGAAGFIGKCLVEKSIIDGPVLSSDLADNNMLSPSAALDALLNTDDISAVFHLGAISSTTETDAVLLTENNIGYSLQLLEICIEKNIPFVYASSASVYGQSIGSQKESQPLAPVNSYAISKTALDLFVEQKITLNPTARIFGLRYFNVFGHHEHHKGDMASPVHKFTLQARETGKIKIFEGSNEYLRDFVHIDDVIAMTLAAPSLKQSGIYNVGTGVSRSFEDVAKIIAVETGAQIMEIPFPEHLKGKYQTYTCSDNTKITINGYTMPRMGLEEGIRKTIALI